MISRAFGVSISKHLKAESPILSRFWFQHVPTPGTGRRPMPE